MTDAWEDMFGCGTDKRHGPLKLAMLYEVCGQHEVASIIQDLVRLVAAMDIQLKYHQIHKTPPDELLWLIRNLRSITVDRDEATRPADKPEGTL